jgi:hypothetical protein
MADDLLERRHPARDLRDRHTERVARTLIRALVDRPEVLFEVDLEAAQVLDLSVDVDREGGHARVSNGHATEIREVFSAPKPTHCLVLWTDRLGSTTVYLRAVTTQAADSITIPSSVA